MTKKQKQAITVASAVGGAVVVGVGVNAYRKQQLQNQSITFKVQRFFRPFQQMVGDALTWTGRKTR